MNGMMLGHWGLVTFPNNENWENVLINEDGSVSHFDENEQLSVTSVIHRIDGFAADIRPSASALLLLRRGQRS